MINKQPRTIAGGQVSRPRVSADGEVVIWSQKVDDHWEMMKFEDGEVVNLSQSPRTHDMRGDLNADGSVIAWRRNNVKQNEIVILRDGVEEVVDVVPADVNRISVSDDGSTVVYDENTQGGFAFNIRRCRGGQVEQITDSRKMDAFPFVSAKGDRIVYTHYDGKNKLMLKDGKAEPKPIVVRDNSAVQPDLSADGRTLIWSEAQNRDFGIHSRDLVSGKIEEVHDQKGVYEKQPQLASETGEIVFTGYDFRKSRPAETNIFLKTEGELHQLSTTDGGRNSFPDFSENGETVVWIWTDQKDRTHQKIMLLER